jgi:hypothetical protein
MTTPVASTFPVLVTVIEKDTVPPDCTTELPALFTIVSAGLFGTGPGQPVTFPDALAFRFPLTAVFVNGPHVVGAVASIEIDTWPPPFGTLAIVQVTTPAACVQVGAPGLELTNVNPVGRVSVTTTFEASALPVLVTVTVQVMF